jgi:hypothetical protein
MHQSHNSPSSSSTQMNDLFSSHELVNIPSEIREKVSRLYLENKQLKSKQNMESDERLILVQNLLDDEKQRNIDLLNKLNESNRQKVELEYQLNANSSGYGSLSMSTCYSLPQSSPDSQENYKKGQFTIIKQMEDRIKALMIENEELRQRVEKEKQIKLKELTEMDEKYKDYMEKAKFIIRSLDPAEQTQQNTDQMKNEIEELKKKLEERDETIKKITVNYFDF